MATPALHDFIATVPSCVQTTTLAAVLQIFSQGQCDRLVVVSENQCPIGVVNLRRIMPQLMTSYDECRGSLDVQQPLCRLELDLIEPIVTIPAQLSVKQFGAYLRSQPDKTNTGFDWALVDAEGKLLGLVDTPRLLQYLAMSPGWAIGIDERRDRVAPRRIDSLVQLLELLPWPVMLQTSSGEVITQNPAWWQQFGTWSAPEQVRGEVEAVLENLEPLSAVSSDSSRCEVGSQPNTCICFFSSQNGQERVWQFVKIPLHPPVVSSQLDNGQRHFQALPENEDNGQIWLLLANDVTEEQQMASELAAKNADLIQLNRLKDEFLACISHELKTPLTAVLGLSSLLKDQLIGELNERQARYARLIHQSSRHLMVVVNDILDLTRIETGQMELTLQSVQIATVCDRAVEQAKAIQPETRQPAMAGEALEESHCDHRFTLLIEPGLDSFVADELRLRQMLVHLLDNAFKFTETGGEIGLRVSRWEGWIAFTVWDTGIGIPEHKQHLIFQKFQQLENPLTRRFEGTGLGLVLTRALARLHGGDVSFLSKEGEGSQFTLLLPPSPPQKVVGNREWAVENRLVLVVEAAPRFIEDLTEQLTGLGYRVVIARSGTEALEKARRLQPGVVFLNPLLPLLSGWDVLTLLKSDAATRQLTVIVTATRADKEQAFLNRADDFLSLPVQQQVLQQILAHFCTKKPGSQSDRGIAQSARTDTPLTILRLVTPHSSLLAGVETQGETHPSPLNYRVVEADDLEQAELLARIWQPDVVLLDEAIPDAVTYLKKLSQHPSLKGLPLVTLDATTTQAASQATGLCVFPYLRLTEERSIDALLPVLEIAAGMSWKASLLVVDVATLPDLPEVRGSVSRTGVEGSELSVGFEWFQALIQYLQKGGLRAVMARSWAEVLQQIRQQSVDLLLICLGDSRLDPDVVAALRALGEQHEVPPVLVLPQRLGPATAKPDTVDSLETALAAIATQILPPSLSMEELLSEINQTLAATRSGVSS